MRKFVIAGAMALALGSPALGAGTVTNSSFVQPNGERVLQLSIDIAAPPAKVWKSLVDEDTLRLWNAPVAHVDLRNGGDIEVSYDAKAVLGSGQTIHHRILTFLPQRLLVLQNISTPPGLPGQTVYPKILQIIELDPLPGGGTRVTLSGSGYGKGADFDRLYAFFANDNPQYLTSLKQQSEKP